ncbi:FGGY-family carbohydrate kinase [Lederbergia citrea]|uniref:FGGY-family carbohydrate kinase n=1 Tax=Lederbergia citrea TaxID=2833581 RepID=UPI001BC9EC23|nr:FGGY family carbohydrate kinase [Lederbergia citrea]MBS4205198.1 carbohydrate kinase [Lederbergia citrea]
MTALLGIDIGTTHCKAGLFDRLGNCLKLASRQTMTHYRSNGEAYYQPDEIWGIVSSTIQEVIKENSETIAAIGITSMAETGLLIDKNSGLPKTEMIPWFDKRAMEEANQILMEADRLERFVRSGLRHSYKYGLPKILWLRKQNPSITNDAIWLSASDFIAYKLTGEFGTDYSLAARTYGFRIDEKVWDTTWLNKFGLDETLFPPARPSGTPMGEVNNEECIAYGLSKGTPVAVSGHDHVCAALAVGAIHPGVVLDSIGTAETLVGTLEEHPLGEKEYKSGLSYGCHVAKNRLFLMGGLPSSGGAVEWIRTQFSDKSLSYDEMLSLLKETDEGPTGILFYPHLSGSGAPNPDPQAKAAFIGLEKKHERKDLLKALLEGTAYQMESIREAVESIAESDITNIVAVGGGTKNKQWMQIKSDISGCIYSIPEVSESTLLGASLAAGIGTEFYQDEEEATRLIGQQNRTEIVPNDEHHQAYQTIYKNGYVQMEKALRMYYQNQLGDE